MSIKLIPGKGTSSATKLRLAEGGFSLIEIMVAVVIGLLGMIVMLQVVENTESRKRTTASGSDAQIVGSIALNNIVTDIRQAGYGFAAEPTLGCNVTAFDATRPIDPNFAFPLAPVQIVPAAVAGAPDRIITLYGNSPTMSLGVAFSNSTNTTKRLSPTSSRGGFLRGDLMLVTGGGGCWIAEVTGNTNADQLTLDHATGGYTDSQNQATNARFNSPFTTPSGVIYSLGSRDIVRRNIWQIVNRRTLTVTDDMHSTPAAEVGDGIVNLQAEYGLDTTAVRDYLVDIWQKADPADWTRVVAVRVALLARSQQFERVAVTTVAPTPNWPGAVPFVMTNVDGAVDSNPGGANDWRSYRYRVYETSIPLRNMIWGTAP
jgi:type IV pilus assembly protein PilW